MKIYLATLLLISLQMLCNGMPTKSCTSTEDCFQTELQKFDRNLNTSLWLTYVKVETKFINMRFAAMRYLTQHNDNIDALNDETWATIEELIPGANGKDCFAESNDMYRLTETAKEDSTDCVFSTFQVMLDIYQSSSDDFNALFEIRGGYTEKFEGCGDDACREKVLAALTEEAKNIGGAVRGIGDKILDGMAGAIEEMKTGCLNDIRKTLEDRFEEILTNINTCLKQ